MLPPHVSVRETFDIIPLSAQHLLIVDCLYNGQEPAKDADPFNPFEPVVAAARSRGEEPGKWFQANPPSNYVYGLPSVEDGHKSLSEYRKLVLGSADAQ